MKIGIQEGMVRTGADNGTRRPGVAGTCILFSGTIILLMLLGYRVQTINFYSGILTTEFLLILLPAVLFAAVSRLKLKEVTRLNAGKAVNYPVILGIMIFAIPLAAVFNLLNLFIVNSIFGRVAVEAVPMAQNGTELLVNIIVIAGSAGLCEEFLFRGIVQRAFERFGAVKSILMAALLFSFTHLDFQKILGTFVLGAIIGYIVYRTNSLLCGIFAHFANNAIAVLSGYAMNKMMKLVENSGAKITASTDISRVFDVFSGLPPEQLVFVFMVYGFMFIFAAIIFILLMYLLKRLNTIPKIQSPLMPATSRTFGLLGSKAAGLLWLVPGLLMIAVWFYVEAHGFLGMHNEVTKVFRYLIGAGA